MKYKWCKPCDMLKPLEDFVKDKRTKDGRHSVCLVCHRITSRERYQADPSKWIADGKAWRKLNPEKYRRQVRKRYWANKDRVQGYSNRFKNKACDELLDTYVRSVLKADTNLTMQKLKAYPELIEMKREYLMIYRATRALQQVIKELENGN